MIMQNNKTAMMMGGEMLFQEPPRSPCLCIQDDFSELVKVSKNFDLIILISYCLCSSHIRFNRLYLY